VVDFIRPKGWHGRCITSRQKERGGDGGRDEQDATFKPGFSNEDERLTCGSSVLVVGLRQFNRTTGKRVVMLSHQSSRVSGRTDVSNVSLCSGKSAMPYFSEDEGIVAYPNSYGTFGNCERITVIQKSENGKGFYIKVVESNGNSFRTLRQLFLTAEATLAYVMGDVRIGNHRLYSTEAPAIRGTDVQMADDEGVGGTAGQVLFSDGISQLMHLLEAITGKLTNAKFIPEPGVADSGVRSNFPTLEKVQQAESLRKVRRVNPSKSFSSGMMTTPAGGAVLPSMTDQIARKSKSSSRNLRQAEIAENIGDTLEAEYRFQVACDYETEVAELRGVLKTRKELLVERIAVMEARRDKRAEMVQEVQDTEVA